MKTVAATTEAPAGAGTIEQAALFLQCLFQPGDHFLLRPIESWIENQKKKSWTDYKHTEHRLVGGKDQAGNWHPVPGRLVMAVRQQMKWAETTRANVFFGVCPRYGTEGRYDLAWQIRTVRVLWADVDDCQPEEAVQRCLKAGLPDPSIIVSSGNGTHLYWILETAYLIDDVGEPPPVFSEFIDQDNGKKIVNKYFVDGETKEKLYLKKADKPIKRNTPPLSPKAQHAQDVLAGLAAKIGGDHTTDLSRLLRVPGTLNRKDQRNGKTPRPCSIVELHADRRYPFSLFEPLAAESPDRAQRELRDKVKLPTPRRMTPSKQDKLNDLLLMCNMAEVGQRSEADFHLCCFAIKSGIGRDELWKQAQDVGKFKEGGERYFDVTWKNAENDVRSTTLGKLQKHTARSGAKGSNHAEHMRNIGSGEGPAGVEEKRGSGRTILVDPHTMPVGDTLHQVTDCLLSAGNCFSRAEQLVVIHDQEIWSIITSPELAGLLNQHVEFFFVDDEEGEYKPLPPAYGNTWLCHHIERGRLPKIKLFTRNPVYTDDWRLVAPGFDDQSGIYYAGPAIEPRNGTERLDALLQDFCFKEPADRTNYLGVLLTAMLVPRFIGSKPAVLFNGNQPELGKSILAQVIAILRDGQSAETATYNPNDEEFEKRLGAIVRRGATTIIIDNAKSRGRNPRIESACLERSITDPILSFRLLGQSASIRAENSHIFCITANTPDVSRDLVTRSVVISLYYEGDPERRQFSIADPEGYVEQHRIELLGELIGMVERWKATDRPMAKTHSRFNKRGWGNIVGGILNACGEPDFLANAEQVATLLDETRREFAELVGVLVGHPQGIWTASELVELCGKHGLLAIDLGEGSSRSLATKMGTLAGRFVGESFSLTDGREAVFHRETDRKGNIYKVSVQAGSAEP